MRSSAMVAVSVFLLIFVGMIGTSGSSWAVCPSGDRGIISPDRDLGRDDAVERELLALGEDTDQDFESPDQDLERPDQDVESPLDTEDTEPIGLLAGLDIDIDRDEGVDIDREEGVGEEIGEEVDRGVDNLEDTLED